MTSVSWAFVVLLTSSRRFSTLVLSVTAILATSLADEWSSIITVKRSMISTRLHRRTMRFWVLQHLEFPQRPCSNTLPEILFALGSIEFGPIVMDNTTQNLTCILNFRHLCAWLFLAGPWRMGLSSPGLHPAFFC